MGKLHEVLSVEPSLKGTVDSFLAETAKTFDGRNAAYSGHSKTYLPLDDKDTDLLPPDSKVVGYTVVEKVDYLSEAYAKFIDCLAQKEIGNTIAKSDLVVIVDKNGVEERLVLAEGMPATLLLALEHRFEKLRKDVFDKAPTLDPNYTWKWDAPQKCWVTPESKTQRLKKKSVVITKAPATDKFPAQTELVSEDVPAGTWTQVLKSGALSLEQKSALLGRLDVTIRALKSARMRANDIEVASAKMGKRIFDFITKGV